MASPRSLPPRCAHQPRVDLLGGNLQRNRLIVEGELSGVDTSTANRAGLELGGDCSARGRYRQVRDEPSG
jgi:hypothetical protein